MSNFNFNAKSLDTLKEIANIGSGNAATALSLMFQKKVFMSVPDITILPFSKVTDQVGGAEHKAVGIYMEVSGTAPCNILFLFPIDSAYAMTDMMMGQPVGTTVQIGQLEASALCEMVNIVGTAYLNSLAKFTMLDFIPSVPAIAVDMAGAILNTIMVQFGIDGDRALLLETEFTQLDIQIKGDFFLLPLPGTLSRILEALGVKE